MVHPVFFEKSADFGRFWSKKYHFLWYTLYFSQKSADFGQKSTIFYVTPCIFQKISWFSKKKSIGDSAYQFESSSETVQVPFETSSETVQVSVETSSETVEL